ncbi:MAG: ABC transporter transmembrane domain-containing protein [Anaeroplasmataceae bacterium]
MKKYNYDKISTYFKLNIKVVIILSITSFLFNVTTAYVPTLQGNVIDSFSNEDPFKTTLKLIFIYVGFILFVQLNRFIKRLCRRRFANKMTLQMRTKAFNNLLLRNIDGFNFGTYGDIMNKQLVDIKDASNAIEIVFAEVFDSGVLLVSYFVFMALMDVKLASICMIFPILSIVISVLLGSKIRKYTKEYKQIYSKTKEENIVVLQNEIYYRGFGINKNYYDKYEASLDELEKKAIKNTVFRTAFEPLYLALGALGYLFAFYIGGLYVIEGIWAIGTLTAFIGSLTFARKKCGFVGRIINNVQNGFVAWERCKEYMVLDYEPKELEPINNEGLIVSNLTFGYDDSFKIKNVSFNANPGEIIGVCGRIRSGKTTLAGALSGVYKYDGSITLGGLELKDITLDKVKSFIHYAPGKVEIFNDTLKYNITFGDEGDFDKAIETACLTDDINKFVNKESEILSHSLLNISGGQQRRLQIARAVFNSPRMVILDDPFNAIGIAMSLEIIKNFKKNYPNTVFIVINNQKESLSLSDKVLYLGENGISFGRYDELLSIEDFKSLIGGDIR